MEKEFLLYEPKKKKNDLYNEIESIWDTIHSRIYESKIGSVYLVNVYVPTIQKDAKELIINNMDRNVYVKDMIVSIDSTLFPNIYYIDHTERMSPNEDDDEYYSRIEFEILYRWALSHDNATLLVNYKDSPAVIVIHGNSQNVDVYERAIRYYEEMVL